MGFCWVLPLLFAAWTKGFTVQGPAVSLSAQLGASVTLPCWVDTPLPLNELEVEWMRAESGTLVHLFQEGQSRPESQNPSYSSRAEFFTEEIPKGNFSLLLKNLNPEDMGMYRCRVHTDLVFNETNVEIKVERLVVTGASEPVFAYAGEDVILNCSVDTHAPLQELEVQWEKTDQQIMVLLFQGGQNIPESQHERFWGRAEFFTEEIPKGNFSLKLRGVRTEDKGEYMCKVHTDTDSVNATAWLRELGFSSLHISVLVLAIASPIVAVALGVPAFRGIIREDESNGSLKLCCLQVVVPCVMICVAFIMWGVIEGFIAEAYTCSAVNLMRILMLFKVAPYLGLFPVILWKFLTEHALERVLKVVTIAMGIFPGLLIYFIFEKQDVIKKIFMVGFFILAMSSFFKLLDIISEKNEVVPQICVYCFGAAGLPIVNCVALATELIQKACTYSGIKVTKGSGRWRISG
ncbi:hypothetical protein JZ751_021292 [Albula glossodonta]|uniref:Ig-like domain-containing protein n=1 Tax=Albula glossodonta TaxID=121402 RepID=A0A8T2MZC0_9TELE|nr:hypothetical protein JZ751_021292 [Albula glossodonta]